MTAVLDTRIPAGLNADGQTPDEARQYQTMTAARVQMLLMQRVPMRTEVYTWTIRQGIHASDDNTIGVDVQLKYTRDGHAARATVMGLAEQFSLDYTDNPHLCGDNIITATGMYAGVPVRFFDLVEPCKCGCGGVR